jgi:uncharacterized membrane-anchored protein YitT (DUF2179 family)
MIKKPRLPHWLADALYISSGAFITGFALRSFLIPAGFLDGGVTGMSLLLHESFHWPIALVIVLANIPFITMGWIQMNRQFAVRTILGVLLLGLCLAFFPYHELKYDHLLVSTFGGVFLGLGIGLGMRGGCALDGIEVLAVYTLRRTSFTIAEIILAFNVIIFGVAATLLNLEIALNAILTYFIASRTINYVIEGLEEFTGVTIISAESERIKIKLAKELGRGITIYKGERGFLKETFDESHDTDIIFTVITRLEVQNLRQVVHNIDSRAFVFTHTIKEAAGGVLSRKPRH